MRFHTRCAFDMLPSGRYAASRIVSAARRRACNLSGSIRSSTKPSTSAL
jgi:hypothetical protein